ncbi:MAG: hypothetical protein PUJ60_02085 [bacterium]|nr:hypothetical protein [bacterium]MDY4108941.1 hypothetical protein [Bacilli bacterium]
MIDFPIPKKYTMQLDNIDKKLCSGYVARLGIDGAIESQFKRLDCSRVKDGLRLMQTIGVPYTYEMSKLAFILYTYLSEDEEDKLKAYLDRLVQLHKDNLKYEDTNPPIVYDKSKKVKNARTPRKKAKEATLEGFEKPKRTTAKSLNADIKAAILGNIKLKIK